MKTLETVIALFEKVALIPSNHKSFFSGLDYQKKLPFTWSD
jgi:hypothetical protein